MEFKNYKTRIIENLIQKKLRTTGAVLVTGPKFCGKTTTCEQIAKTKHSFSTSSQIDMYEISLNRAMVGETPILIDEWQNIPQIWDEVRNEIDSRNEFGQFLLTGSIQPVNNDEIIHSGAGRFSRVVMYPFSLYESGDSNGLASLGKLFENPQMDLFETNEFRTLDDVAYLICRGGWPTALIAEKEDALEIAENYLTGILYYKSKNSMNYFTRPQVAEKILKSYARNISTEAANSTLIADILAADNMSMDDETFTAYLEKLRNMFIVEDLSAWNPNLRSKTAIRTTSTRHFVDTSIACSVLGIHPNDLLNDVNTFGLFFEDMVIRDLRIYCQELKAEIYHYRDKDNLECDAIIHLKDGSWAAIEVKLGGEKLINEGVVSLNKLRNKIDYSRFKEPSFMAVITASGPMYKTKEGIFIIPLTMLKN